MPGLCRRHEGRGDPVRYHDNNGQKETAVEWQATAD